MRSFILFCCTLFSIAVTAQNSIQELMNSKDLSGFKVEMLSNEDIAKYKSMLQNSGFSESEAEQLALQRGLPTSELFKLRTRISDFSSTSNSKSVVKSPNKNSNNRAAEPESVIPVSSKSISTENEIFGSDLFTNPDSRFEVNLRMPTPKNYIIGPDDEISIDIFGYQEANYKLVVTPEGVINIPSIGYVSVNGLTIDQATQRIKTKMIKSGYSRLANGGQTQLAVNISKIRTIKVTVIGQATKPATYSLSSLSTLFNALYACGGPNEKGSLRKIELIRDNKVIAVFDAYDYLLKGFQSKNLRLNDQDVIRIPVAAVQVKLKGEVMRPGIFEMLPNESLSQLINYAQGFTSSAYTASVLIDQFTDKEKKMQDVLKEDFTNYFPNRGDVITVGKILDRYSNRVSISGAVYRPGRFELTPKLTLSQLIQKADGIQEDAYVERGLLFRTNNDLTKEVVAFDVAAIINGKQQDVFLKKDDSVLIASAKNFSQLYTLSVEGEVKNPGVFEYFKGITLKDLLFQTGGFTDAASPQRIEIARRVQSDTATKTIIAEVIEIAGSKDLSFKGNEFLLQPWDVVSVRTNPGYKVQLKVRIEGEVLYPGTYVLESKEERVSDILKRAGGLTPQANNSGANIIRINTSNLKNEASETINKFKKVSDTSTQLIEELNKPTVKIGLRLDEIMNNQENNLENITLVEGDIINIPKQKNVVKVNGEVMFSTEIVYKQGESIDYYIDKAGGFTDNAKKKRLYVLNANGTASKTKKFLFFRTFPNVQAGSEILVPRVAENNKKGLSSAEWLAVASGVASLAGVVVAIINLKR
jgi:protein involved in polysaccharide export with SLBB domain